MIPALHRRMLRVDSRARKAAAHALTEAKDPRSSFKYVTGTSGQVLEMVAIADVAFDSERVAM